MTPRLSDMPKIKRRIGLWSELPEMPDLATCLMSHQLASKSEELSRKRGGGRPMKAGTRREENQVIYDRILELLSNRPMTARQIWEMCIFPEYLTKDQSFLKISNMLKAMRNVLCNDGVGIRTNWSIK